MGLSTIDVCVISSYPPVSCGVAEYCHNLLEHLRKIINLKVVLYPIETQNFSYKEQVGFRIKKEKEVSYKTAGEKIAKSNCKLVILQHQFLLYGKEGCFTRCLLEPINKPILAIIHTVPVEPTSKEREAILAIREKASLSVVMIHYAHKLLVTHYDFSPEKVEVIFHPFPFLPKLDNQKAKKKLGLPTDFTVLTTFGLLRREKGIEDVIEALADLREEKVLYLIVGGVHPAHLSKEGDRYLKDLREKAKKLGVEDRIKWCTQYIEEKDLGLYLSATDFYIAPYLSTQQVSSGTLTYALGMGKIVISTPFPFAKEMLGEGRGVLVNYHSPKEIAQNVKRLMYNKKEREKMEREIVRFSKSIAWPKAAEKFKDLILKIL